MHFDYVTWSIWAVGLVILVIWIIVPMKEFISMVNARRREYGENVSDKADEVTGNEGGKRS